MSLIRHGIVALTGLGPVYGLQLGGEIAARTGRQLNPGQIYSTLARCQRDGLITEVAKTHDNLALFAATPAGLESTAQWFNSVECDWDHMVFQLSLARTLPEQLLPAQQLANLISNYRRAWQSVAGSAGHEPGCPNTADPTLTDLDGGASNERRPGDPALTDLDGAVPDGRRPVNPVWLDAERQLAQAAIGWLDGLAAVGADPRPLPQVRPRRGRKPNQA